MSRPFITVCAASSLAVAGGCGGGPKADLLVAVSDAATGEPVAGAKVVVLTPSRHHPFSVASILGQTGEVSDESRTDASGEARVRFVEGRPVRVTVLKRGYLPATWFEDGEPPERVGIELAR